MNILELLWFLLLFGNIVVHLLGGLDYQVWNIIPNPLGEHLLNFLKMLYLINFLI